MSDTLKAITFDQAKAKLNLGEAHLYAGTESYGPYGFGIRDFDTALGRTVHMSETRKLIRLG